MYSQRLISSSVNTYLPQSSLQPSLICSPRQPGLSREFRLDSGFLCPEWPGLIIFCLTPYCLTLLKHCSNLCNIRQNYSYNTRCYNALHNQACMDFTPGTVAHGAIIKPRLTYCLTVMCQSDYIKVQALSYIPCQSRLDGQKAPVF